MSSVALGQHVPFTYSGEAVVVEIAGKLFGIDTAVVKSIVELASSDDRLLIEPYLGSYFYQNAKIPLLNFADFFLLSPSSALEKVVVIVIQAELSFAVLVSRVLGKFRSETSFPLPQEVFLYPHLYPLAVEFN
ncbi:MAG: chemotaxis protein CheW, partial [Candidatus Thermochlorobacter sp.]